MNEDNKKDLHNQEDVNPGSELEKLVNEDGDRQLPRTHGTGSNNAVARRESLTIRDENLEDDADS